MTQWSAGKYNENIRENLHIKLYCWRGRCPTHIVRGQKSQGCLSNPKMLPRCTQITEVFDHTLQLLTRAHHPVLCSLHKRTHSIYHSSNVVMFSVFSALAVLTVVFSALLCLQESQKQQEATDIRCPMPLFGSAHPKHHSTINNQQSKRRSPERSHLPERLKNIL